MSAGGRAEDFDVAVVIHPAASTPLLRILYIFIIGDSRNLEADCLLLITSIGYRFHHATSQALN